MLSKFFTRSRVAERGFTFIDLMAAVGVVAIGFAGIFYSNSRALNMLRASKETVTASKMLQQRMELVRLQDWAEVTDVASVQTLMGTAADASGLLTNPVETITVSPFPPSAGAATIQVQRAANGTVTQISDNPNLVDGNSAVRVDVRVTWTGTPNGRTRLRETSTVVANGGLGG